MFDPQCASRHYAEKGWFITDGILGTDLIGQARETVRQVQTRERDGVIPAWLQLCAEGLLAYLLV